MAGDDQWSDEGAKPAAGARSRLLGGQGRDGDGGDEGGLPWLEPVEDETAGGLLSPRVLAGIGVAFVILFAAFIWFFYAHFSSRDDARVADVAPELIEAPAQPYKVRPDDPGGMDIPDQDKYVLDGEAPASQPLSRLAPGAETPAPRDVPGGYVTLPDEAPETPEAIDAADSAQAILEAARQSSAGSPAAPAPKAATPAAAAPEKPFLIQLGAFSTREKAQAGWDIFAGKYPDQLGGLEADLERATIGGKDMVRLRAAGFATRDEAEKRCAALKVLGQNCLIVAR